MPKAGKRWSKKQRARFEATTARKQAERQYDRLKKHYEPPTIRTINTEMIDLRNVGVVEVLIQADLLYGASDMTEGRYTVWVNTEDGCKFRAQGVRYVLLNDQRESS